jgi:hypothetical protein
MTSSCEVNHAENFRTVGPSVAGNKQWPESCDSNRTHDIPLGKLTFHR